MRPMRNILLINVVFLALPTWTMAQAATVSRKLESELSGSIFFGNTSQTLASTRVQFERRDSTFGFRLGGRFHYGESTPEPGGTFVSKRAWELDGRMEFLPHGDFAPFVRANVNASLENRIALRSSIGVGSLYRVVQTGGTDVVLSVGAAGENTRPIGDTLSSTTLVRGNTTVRLRRDFSSTVSLTTETSYQPAFRPTSDYTIVSVTALRTRLSSFAALTLTFRDNYDSRAVLRGARVSNDGELLVGLLTSF